MSSAQANGPGALGPLNLLSETAGVLNSPVAFLVIVIGAISLNCKSLLLHSNAPG